MEEDRLKGFDFEINNIINHCLNGREITATEYVFIKQTLLLKIEDLIKKNERLINKYKEQEKIIELMSKAIHQLAISYDIAKNFPERYCKTWYAKDPRKCKELICEECVKNYFKKKVREENETN